MSDDTPTPDTDTVDAGAVDAPAESAIDYEQRYNSLRSEFDRRNQHYSEVEQKLSRLSDPQSRAEVLAEYGLELEAEDDDTPVYDDQTEELAARQEALERAWQQQQDAAQTQAEQEATADYILSEIATIEKKEGRELSAREVKFVSLAAQAEPDEQGRPDVSAAWTDLIEHEGERQQSWLKTKRAPGAPKGQSASKQPDLSNANERQAYIDSRMAVMDD